MLFINRLFFKCKYWALYNPILALLIITSIYFCGFSASGKNKYELLGYYFGFLLFYWNLRNHMFRNLFNIINVFNERYDKLNDCLNSLGSSLNDESKARIIDYFNLCSEEYYFYKHGYIPDDVWQQWKNGMVEHFNKDDVKLLADIEFGSARSAKQNSYYGFDPDALEIILN